MSVTEKNETKKKGAVAFVNWTIQGKLKSTKGFSLFDNEHTTKSDKQLIELAKKHNGSVKVIAELNIVINKAVDTEDVDLDDIMVITD